MPSFSMLRRTSRRRNSEFAKPAGATVVTVTEDVLGGTGDVAVAEGLGLGGTGSGRGRFGGLGLGLTFNHHNSDKTNSNGNSNNTLNSNESSRRYSIDGHGRDISTTQTTNEKKKERRGSRRDLFLQDIRSRLTGKLPPTNSNNTSSPSSGTSTPHQHQPQASPKAPRGRAASQPPIPISERRREYLSDREGGEEQTPLGMGTIREAVSRTSTSPPPSFSQVRILIHTLFSLSLVVLHPSMSSLPSCLL
ncbi:hypothetical protein QBC32DRAFT_261267 [Pseudoneurospora amorphoporcata]|uniref:Uncharacterized protein n=1 Tax=Pseudoneurospora amorphoporcata TaxID=241081 RepID=A0AAN6NTU7_9PEZI|nr:hypothetical protein QBC32DRAFT_261267 [Pseudoneurospora amorphoporcata]